MICNLFIIFFNLFFLHLYNTITTRQKQTHKIIFPKVCLKSAMATNLFRCHFLNTIFTNLLSHILPMKNAIPIAWDDSYPKNTVATGAIRAKKCDKHGENQKAHSVRLNKFLKSYLSFFAAL